MKSTIHFLATLILLTAPAGASAVKRTPQNGPTFEVPRSLTFLLELQNSPDIATPDSLWETSVQLRVADQSDYMRWIAQRKSGQVGVTEPGFLLTKKSFKRHDLSLEANRRVEFTVPVDGELLQRFLNVKKAPQVVWISSTIRIHSGKLKADVGSDQVTPFWDLRYFIKKAANVMLELKPGGYLTWSSGDGNSKAIRKTSL
jgi:hypothetical protein